MTNRQLRRYRMLARIRDFGVAHGSRIPDATLADEAFAAVGEAVTELNDHAVAQLALKRKGAKARAAARVALVTMLESISRTARVIQTEDPSFPNTFLMPEARSAPVLITAAQLFARDVEPFAEKFAAHAMPETFIADLKRLLGEYEHAFRDGEKGLGQSAAARESIETAMASGITAARKLDVIIANHLGKDAMTMAEWRRSRRVGHRVSKAPVEPVTSAAVPLEPTEAAPSGQTTPALTLVPANPSPPAHTSDPDVPSEVQDEHVA